ncbi:WXG100 family type VII secretion target [Saccharothrix syringae]|uniref:ESAT-6-like protein n=1 Tax=Saccharothrix syringae TaxID=103733 RepID=A0A5Q0HB17_SACSY|nr:WXG100 family type VII secretion target [Saccharothrix syringae]QFZ23436.1 WXG100 family type VII secretion target [Saccharothrix syringae]
MAGFSTGHEELVQAGKDIVDTNGNVQGILNNLEGTVEALASTWSGSARIAFDKLMERFNADAAKLQKALLDIAEQMSGTAATYMEQEEQQSQEMSTILGRLGN